MSRPRFLGDNDLDDAIIQGVLQHEPAAEFLRLRDLGLADRPDPEVLAFAADQRLIVVSHDVNTMSKFARARMEGGLAMTGLFLVHQSAPVGPVIDNLILIWAASEAEEWRER